MNALEPGGSLSQPRARNFLFSRVLAPVMLAMGLLCVGGAAAQSATATGATAAPSEADVRRMIDSLRRPDPASGRTRNLIVVPAQEAAGPSPSAPPPVAAPAAAAQPGATPAPAAAAPPAPTRPSTPAAALQGTAPAPAAATTAPTVATAPAAATPGPAAGEGGASLSLAIAFEPNSAQLRPESGATLGALVSAMLSAELRTTRFTIEGHTDASGSAAQNLRLSRERAEQVRLFLVTLGVPGERLRAVGKGSAEPVNRRDPRSPENRRVRVVALP